jgi:flagellum-specific ATP synthase
MNPRLNREVLAEVVGFRDRSVLLMPLGEMTGIAPGNDVVATGMELSVGIGQALLGRVLDGLGNPIDGKGRIEIDGYYPVNNMPPHPMERPRISEVLPLGVKCIDSLLTVGKGQRMGIFAGSGVGKSTLMGMIARNTKADINVIALIGERGREVRDFLERDLQEDGLKRSVVIVATSDQPALIRKTGAMLGTAIAEYFRDQGNDVLLLMDSLTRFSMAQREIGLSIGEPPVSRGYTPSVFSVMPKLLERSGTSEKGSITGLYTVLVDGDDMTEPVTDTARSILDGHIVLSRQMAHRNHYPAVDVLGSISRVMSDIVTGDHKKAAGEIRKNLAVYHEAEDLINVGAYVKGSNPDIDRAISVISEINAFLVQSTGEKFTFEKTLELMKQTTQK